MTPLKKRVRKQRILVRRLRAQLAFETLVLARLDARARSGGVEQGVSVATVLANARRRRLAPDLRP